MTQVSKQLQDEQNRPLISVTLLKSKFVVWNYDDATFLYHKFRFFGKPVGVRKVITTTIQHPLHLSYFEVLYLLDLGKIQVKAQGRPIARSKIVEILQSNYENFLYSYCFYKDLRDRNYVVRPGMKFGADFILYEKGPGKDHSKYVVHINKTKSKFRVIDLVRAVRLSGSVNKLYLIAYHDENTKIRYLKLERIKF